MIDLKLPFWLSGPELDKLRRAALSWWTRAEGWMRWPLGQLDPLTCAEPMLDLLAYQRRVVRFRGEPLPLYRRRVAHAYANAKDSGQKAGFFRIFARLEIPLLDQRERTDPVDWDVILLDLPDSATSEYGPTLEFIVQEYGRTCRRYRLGGTDTAGVFIAAGETGHTWYYDHAELP